MVLVVSFQANNIITRQNDLMETQYLPIFIVTQDFNSDDVNHKYQIISITNDGMSITRLDYDVFVFSQCYI